ncbi:MAG: hypothetical protein AB7O52_04440 [Planctomycetota bacterium]
MSRRLSPFVLGLCVSFGGWPGLGVATAQQVTVESGGRGPKHNETLLSPEARPIIRYGGTRTSKSWLESDNLRVAVDDGIEWRGRRYYASLSYDLLGTEITPPADTGTVTPGVTTQPAERVLWRRHLGAFWNQLGIEVMTDGAGATREVLALRSTTHPEFAEFVDLETGKKVGGHEPGASPPGVPIALGGMWKGAEARADAKRMELIRSASEWSLLRAELFGDVGSAPPAELPVDFDGFVVVVVFGGKGTNCNGFSAQAYENENAIVLRASAHTYQSEGETPPRWPYGVFAVPLRHGKSLVLERNTQNLIGGPALWREWHRWELP